MLDDLITRLYTMPRGEEELVLLREGLDRAIEASDTVAEYKLRLFQTHSALWHRDPETMLTAFQIALALHDSDPARYPRNWQYVDILWEYKWLPVTLMNHPGFSVAQIAGIEDDLQRRYVEAGLGLRGVWQTRFTTSIKRGDPAAAALYRQSRDAIERDSHSDCPACEAAQNVEQHLLAGNDEAAATELNRLLDEGLRCAEQPASAIGLSLTSLVRLGNLEDTARLHRISLRDALATLEPFPLVLPQIQFLAQTGNLGRGLQLVEQFLPEFHLRALDMHLRFEAARAFGVLLDVLANDGHADLLIVGGDSTDLSALIGESDGTAAGLAGRFWAFADEAAAAFDARNGTDRYAHRLAEGRAIREHRIDLPLYDVPIVRERLEITRSPRDRLQRAELLRRILRDDAGWRAELAAALDETDDPGLAAAIRESLNLTDAPDASPDIAALSRALDAAPEEARTLLPALFDADEAWIRLLARLRAAENAADENRFADAADHADAALEAVLPFGVRPVTAHAAATAARMHRASGDVARAKNMFRVAIRQFQLDRASGEAIVRYELGELLLADSPDVAGEEFALAAELEESSGRDEHAANALIKYAEALTANQFDEAALSALVRARSLAESASPKTRIMVGWRLGSLLLDMWDNDAVDRLTEALAIADAEGVRGEVTGLVAMTGRAMARVGDPDGLALLAEGRAWVEEFGDEEWLAEIVLWTGDALASLNRPGDAAAEYLDAVRRFDALDDPVSASTTDIARAWALEASGDRDAALQALHRARERMSGDPHALDVIDDEIAALMQDDA